MFKYRITKYNPKYRTPEGNYINDEWTALSDVGRLFDNKIFLIDEYLSIESEYCDIIKLFLEINNVTEMRVKNLEKRSTKSSLIKYLKKYGINVNNTERRILSSIKENMIISVGDIETYIKLILRECFWCRLESVNTADAIEFGFDFYTYFYSLKESFLSRKNNIFIEKYANDND